MIGDFDWDLRAKAASHRAKRLWGRDPEQIGDLTIQFKGGDTALLHQVPQWAIEELHSHLAEIGSGWRIMTFDEQSVALNLTEVTALFFSASPHPVRA